METLCNENNTDETSLRNGKPVCHGNINTKQFSKQEPFGASDDGELVDSIAEQGDGTIENAVGDTFRQYAEEQLEIPSAQADPPAEEAPVVDPEAAKIDHTFV